MVVWYKMNKLLEDLITGMNPLHDFDKIKFYNLSDTKTLIETWEVTKKNYTFLLTLPKPIIRGSVVGGIVGILGSYIVGDSIKESYFFGTVIGMTIDFKQYTLRGIYHYFKAQGFI